MRLAIICMIWFLLTASAALAQSAPPSIFVVCPTAIHTDACESLTLEDIDPQGRELWISTVVQSEQVATDAPVAIYVWAMAASEVYWNGEMIGQNGVPGATPGEEQPGLMDWILYLHPGIVREGQNELRIHMSSHHNLVHVVRPVHVIGVGRFADPRSLRLSYYLPALLTAGGLILAAVYFGGAFAQDRRNWGALFLMLLSISVVGQLAAEMSRGLIGYPYTWHLPRLIVVALFALGFGMSLSCYVAWRIDRRSLLVAMACVGILGAASIVLAPSFDLKAVFPILIGSVISLGLVLLRMRDAGRTEWIIGASIALFILLIIFRQGLFLDQDFYLAAFVLAGVLFVGELQSRQRERSERAAALARAKELEVELLRRQISPHFLMNTLNTLSAWVEQDPGKGLDIIETLGEEYRAIDRLSLRKLIPMADEIALCRSHLKLLSYRAEARFALDVQGKMDRILIPPTVLLTLIENAFSHNFYKDDETITVDIEDRETSWHISVHGPRKDAETHDDHQGTGHDYIQARLEDAFGKGKAHFETPLTPDTWRGIIVIPKIHD